MRQAGGGGAWLDTMMVDGNSDHCTDISLFSDADGASDLLRGESRVLLTNRRKTNKTKNDSQSHSY